MPTTSRSHRAAATSLAAPTAGALITLTSDFGLRDPYVGVMKARIAQRAPHVCIIDLTHQITPFQFEEAGYWLYCCHGQFPQGSVHVAVVDPGVGSERAIVVLCASQQLFVAPDNGLLGLLASSDPGACAYRVEAASLVALGLRFDSTTFHGRDIMAPLAAELISGRVRPEQLGPRLVPQPGSLQLARRAADGSIAGTIAVIDHFGNALTTIPGALIGPRLEVRLRPGAPPLRRVRTYAEARPGECVALINSASMLELAVREGSAAKALNVKPGQAVYLSEG